MPAGRAGSGGGRGGRHVLAAFAQRHGYDLATPLNFSEYWGDAVACTNVPISITDFTQPAANSRGGGLYDFGSTYSSYSRGSCTGGGATEVNLGWTRADRVTLGDP